MAKPTQDQLQFFQKYKIPLSNVLDATGMPNPKYQKIMDDLGFIAAIGVTPCQRSKHTVRDKHGHCIQCDVKTLVYAARYHAEASVYIAYSGAKTLVKIGLAGIAKDRVLNLNTYSYGGATDWTLYRQWMCENVGRVENDAHKILEDFQVDGTYFKNGSNILCQELFDCTVDQAIEAVTRAIAGVTTKIYREGEEIAVDSQINKQWPETMSQDSRQEMRTKLMKLFYEEKAKKEQESLLSKQQSQNNKVVQEQQNPLSASMSAALQEVFKSGQELLKFNPSDKARIQNQQDRIQKLLTRSNLTEQLHDRAKLDQQSSLSQQNTTEQKLPVANSTHLSFKNASANFPAKPAISNGAPPVLPTRMQSNALVYACCSNSLMLDSAETYIKSKPNATLREVQEFIYDNKKLLAIAQMSDYEQRQHLHFWEFVDFYPTKRALHEDAMGQLYIKYANKWQMVFPIDKFGSLIGVGISNANAEKEPPKSGYFLIYRQSNSARKHSV